MPNAVSIHVGINRVDSNNYTADTLKGCENDAQSMFDIAMALGFKSGWVSPTGEPCPLLGSEATFHNVVNAVKRAAPMESGDIFLFTFAGHGSQRAIQANPGEPDGNDETILLYDHMLLDDYWASDLWPRFARGVRIVAVADCCHSRTTFLALNDPAEPPLFDNSEVAVSANAHLSAGFPFGAISHLVGRGIDMFTGLFTAESSTPSVDLNEAPMREISLAAKKRHLEDSKAFYDEHSATILNSIKPIEATRLLLSACQDDEKAADGEDHGAFTRALLEVWDSGHFNANYHDFIQRISEKVNRPNQHPSLVAVGEPDFSAEPPFKIK